PVQRIGVGGEILRALAYRRMVGLQRGGVIVDDQVTHRRSDPVDILTYADRVTRFDIVLRRDRVKHIVHYGHAAHAGHDDPDQEHRHDAEGYREALRYFHAL